MLDKIKIVVERTDTKAGKIYDFFIQFLIVLSLISFSFETLPGISNLWIRVLRGIEVFCIGGDIGIKTNEFDHLTSDGIQFLASGLSIEADENKALLFHHDILNRQLTWEYKLITDL